MSETENTLIALKSPNHSLKISEQKKKKIPKFLSDFSVQQEAPGPSSWQRECHWQGKGD